MNPQEPSDRISRRSFGLGALGSGVVASGIATSSNADLAAAATSSSAPTQGRLNQSLCKWCYDKNLSLDELCQAAKSMGMVGIDLLTKKDFATLKSHDLVCTMVSSHKLSDGLCDPKYWDEALKILNETIEDTSAAGFRNVICFSGNARGIDRKIGLKNCAEALRKIVPVAEKKKVILNIELLNSRVDSTCCGVGSMKPSIIVASTKAIRIHQLVGGSTGPGYGMLCFESQEKILRWLKRPFFIWDKCCHQTLCLHLMESN